MMKISLSLELGRSYLTWKEKNKFYFRSWLKHEEIERLSTSLEWTSTTSEWASQVVLVVKNLPANAGDVRNMGLIPGSGRSPGKGNGNPLQYPCMENSMDGGGLRATVHGLQRVGHDWMSNTFVFALTCIDLMPIFTSELTLPSLPISGHVSYFSFLAVMNKATINNKKVLSK